MYLMYVDESGDIGLTRSPTRYFILCGLVFHELRWRLVLDELLALRHTFRVSFGLKVREELHASHLFNRPKELQRIPKHQRLEMLRRLADKLAIMPDLSLINVVVDKTGKALTYDVFAAAWEALLQRFENTLSHRNFPGPKNPDDKGILFCDDTDKFKLTKMVRKMRNYNPVPHQAGMSPGYRNLRIASVIEDPNFRDSSTSLLIQSVDTCAYLLQQHVNPSTYFRSKSAQNYFQRLGPICCKVASRFDPLGIVKL